MTTGSDAPPARQPGLARQAELADLAEAREELRTIARELLGRS